MASLIPVRQAASEFHVDRTTLHRHIRAGRLHAYRRPMDRRTYVDRDELHELLTFRPVPQGETVADRLARLREALAGLAEIRRQMRTEMDAVAIVREGRRELEERGADV
ncbi:MAG TPA: helix-turn-helix domain-containing protein [Terriglobales bacterium]|nr:helix-turn-helix domain-containing protein [Terriglobales bacterium]